MAKICQNFKNIVRTYWGSDIAHQIVTDCRKVKEKRKMFSQTSDSDWCQQWCLWKSNRKKKKKDQSCKDINVKSAAIVTYLETMSNEELLKVEIIKL